MDRETKLNNILEILRALPSDLKKWPGKKLLKKLQEIKRCAGIHHDHKPNKPLRKEFDFRRYKKRHIALKFLYLGWDCDGFAAQDNTEETIEAYLFEALTRTKLIESRETSNYHRCGRTDRGVSAFSQVISIDVRSNLLEGRGIYAPEGYIPDQVKVKDKEADYVATLNQVLPPEIRAVAWAPVEANFSARFDCMNRTYKYWFPKADLDVLKMQDAASRLVGEHDYRNLCKLDVKNDVTNYVRKISEVLIAPVPSTTIGPYQMMELTIKGTAFLWHQIRCIVTILILVGQGKEDPLVVDFLLDINKCPQKPQYTMAADIPLVLYDCEYEGVEWNYQEENIKIVISQLQAVWTKQSAKTTIIHRMLQELEFRCSFQSRVCNQAETLLLGNKRREYKPLLQRPLCQSLEQKLANQKKRTEGSFVKKSLCEENKSVGQKRGMMEAPGSDQPSRKDAWRKRYKQDNSAAQKANVFQPGSCLTGLK